MGKEDVCVCVCMYIYMYIHIHTQWSIHNRIIISHKKKNEVLPFVTTWMDPESIMLSEISQRFTYMWNLKTKQSKKKKKKSSQIQRPSIDGCQRQVVGDESSG